jgi:hypothetical protein
MPLKPLKRCPHRGEITIAKKKNRYASLFATEKFQEGGGGLPFFRHTLCKGRAFFLEDSRTCYIIFPTWAGRRSNGFLGIHMVTSTKSEVRAEFPFPYIHI